MLSYTISDSSGYLIHYISYSVKSRMAVGYNPDGSVAALTNLGWEGPAGQMYSSVNDLNKVYFTPTVLAYVNHTMAHT